MRFIRKALSSLQTHIISVFSLLLFLSFAMVGLAFNIAVNRYVSSSAAEAIIEARIVHEMVHTRPGGFFMRIFGGAHRFADGTARFFEMSSDFNPLPPFITEDAMLIAGHLEENYPMMHYRATRLRVNDRSFYASISPLNEDRSLLAVYYLDVTDILRFSAVINRLLLAMVALIWFVSVVVAKFLSDSMVNPLRSLRDFVRQIGRGDFTQSTRTFANDEFEELNQSLNQAARQLATYDEHQKTFFQNVSHELRTPLMSIKSYAEGIKFGVMEPGAASETILAATENLSERISNILYVSRLDSLTAPTFEKANLCAIVNARIKAHQHIAEAEDVELKYVSGEHSLPVECVTDYIERAVDNLISNAIRYAKAVITVECFAEGGKAVVRFADDGAGFDRAELPRVFERFYRGKKGLTGIGLSMVKSIVEQHKGTVTAENGKKGAVVTLSLPLKR